LASDRPYGGLIDGGFWWEDSCHRKNGTRYKHVSNKRHRPPTNGDTAPRGVDHTSLNEPTSTGINDKQGCNQTADRVVQSVVEEAGPVIPQQDPVEHMWDDFWDGLWDGDWIIISLSSCAGHL
jgi:hypothetical protein